MIVSWPEMGSRKKDEKYKKDHARALMLAIQRSFSSRACKSRGLATWNIRFSRCQTTTNGVDLITSRAHQNKDDFTQDRDLSSILFLPPLSFLNSINRIYSGQKKKAIRQCRWRQSESTHTHTTSLTESNCRLSKKKKEEKWNKVEEELG